VKLFKNVLLVQLLCYVLFLTVASSVRGVDLPRVIEYSMPTDQAGLNKHLRRAVKYNNVKWATELLVAGADANTTGRIFNEPVLVKAVDKGYSAIVELLLNYGADVNAIDSCHKESVLRLAVVKGYVDVARLLIARGANVLACNSFGTPLLVEAVSSAEMLSSARMVQLLLDSNAPIDSVESCGTSALYWAVIKLSLLIVRLLLDRGIDVNIVNCYGDTALSAAQERGLTLIVDMIQERIAQDRRMSPLRRAFMGAVARASS